MSRTYTCEKKCCTIEISDYTQSPAFRPRRGYCHKAGVFIFDPEQNMVLLVQSRGQLWGPPKGTLENESSYECAIREVEEETGLKISAKDLSRATRIKNRALYYYAEKKVCKVNIQDIEGNDANGITWIKLDCLNDCIRSGQIVLNQHCKIVFKRFLNKVFPTSGFVKVISRRKKRSRKKSLDSRTFQASLVPHPRSTSY